MLDELIKKIIEDTVLMTLEKTGALDINKPQTPDTMTVKQLALYLGMSEQWVYEKTKELPHEKRGRKTLFIKSEIDEWREQQREEKELDKSRTIKTCSNKVRGNYKVV